MTISSENKRNDFVGNGTTDTYSYTFKIASENDLKVTQRNLSDVETTLVLNTDYTVTGVGAAAGGTIVLTAGNLTSGFALTIRRDSELKQETDIRNQGDFFPETHEDVFDHLMSVDQTQQVELDRSIKIPETYPNVSTELPGPVADKVLKWNSAGTALTNVDPGDATLNIPADDSVTGPKIDDSALFVFPTMLSLQKGADVASAAALALTLDGNYFDITGTTAITSINTIGIGTQVILQFDAALTLTHHATDLILPGGANITTAAGDHAYMVEYALNKWQCVTYIKANGHPVATTLSGITLTSPSINTPTLSGAISGAVIANDGIQTDGANTLKTKIVEIGAWDMDTVTNVNIAHGLTFSKIRDVSVMIYNDAQTALYNFMYDDTNGTTPVGITVGIAEVTMYRATNGFFDNTNHNDTGVNRGYITITYIA